MSFYSIPSSNITNEGAPNLPLSPLKRTGRVFFYDDFESGAQLAWLFGGGAGGSVARTTTYVGTQFFRGQAGLSVITAASANALALAVKRFGIPPQGKTRMSLEFWFRSPNVDAHLAQLYFNPTLYDGVNRYEAEVAYIVATTNWNISLVNVGSYTAIGTQAFNGTNNDVWNWLRYTWDWSTNKRISIQCNEKLFLMAPTDTGMVATADTTNPQIYLQIGVKADASGSAASLYLDDISLAVENP